VLLYLDQLLDDDVLYTRVRADLATRYPQTLVHGRHSTPVEVLLRLLIVKHLYRWSYRETEARVADSLVLRWFCRVYFQSVPDATTLLRWAHTIRPDTLHALNDRVVQLAHQARVTGGRKLRIDGTAVQTVIHHPTDSSLLADGVRVLSRLIRRSKPVVQEACAGVRDAFRTRMRTMRGGLRTLHRLRRRTGDDHTARRVAVYTKLVAATRATVTQAQGVLAALHGVGSPVKRHTDRLRTEIARYIPLVEQVIRQTERRVFAGEQVPAAEKLVSLFEPHTRIVPRHKGGAAVEFGRLVVVDEVEGGIVTRRSVWRTRPANRDSSPPPSPITDGSSARRHDSSPAIAACTRRRTRSWPVRPGCDSS
jgi:IS5 family transposase